MYVNLHVGYKSTYIMKHNVKIALESRKDKSGEIINENVPILAMITYGGNRLNYFTGYRIDAIKFENQLATKNSTGKEGSRIVQYNEINNRLKAIKASMELYFQNIDEANKYDVKSRLDKVCNKGKKDIKDDDYSFFGMFDKYINDRIAKSRQKHIRTVYNHWKKYETKRNYKLTFESVTVEILRNFENYLRYESTITKKDKEVFSPKGQNTINRILKVTRTFWNYSRKELRREAINISYPFGDGYQLPGEQYGKPIYLTTEERNTLFNADISNEKLSRVRDLFVFQCLIGARVGDMCKFTKANVQNNVLSYIPRKTKEGKPVTVNVPLHPMAIEILSRYDMPDHSLLPFISGQKYNDYLKDMFKDVGIDRIVTRLNPRTNEEEQVKLCDIVSSHMARRAFVGNLYGKVDNGIISSMSGHIPNSRAFSRYYDVSSELQQDAINKL